MKKNVQTANRTTISLKEVSKVIKKATILDHINVEFHSGRVYGLRGYNGSGKTMLLRLIAGLILPTNGSVYINNKVLGRDITFPESMGILIENPAFLDSYTGYQNLKLLADLKRQIGEEQIRKALESVGLDSFDPRKYRKYSLGMKQRLGIAAAIMEENDILLIDEPTNALDSEGVDLVKKIIKSEKARGALILVACHEAQVLEALADEIYVIEKGQLVDHIVLQTIENMEESI